MYELRQILVRMRFGDSDRALAKAGLIGRPKAKALRRLAEGKGWLDPARPLPEDAVLAEALPQPRQRSSSVSSVEPFRDKVEQWVAQEIPCRAIHQVLKREHQYTGSYSSVYRFVQSVKPSQPKATMPLEFAAGDAAQIDFGSGPELIDMETGEVVKTWFFLMTLCWSRHQYAEIVLDQKVPTWLECHRRAFEWFGGVPQKLIIDNAKCAITRACRRDPVVQRAYAEYAEGYGFKIDALPPRQPQMKGRVESGIKYLKTGFLPLREFRDVTDANRQLQAWILEWAKVKVHRDCHVQFEKCLYSVPFKLIGQSLWLKATPVTVRIYRDHELAAVHSRHFKPGSRSSIDDHLPPEAIAWKMRDPQWCLQQSENIGASCHQLIRTLFADRVLDNLRAAQGVIRLRDKYGGRRLEAACQRALSYNNPRYRTVKTILEKGLEQHPSAQLAFDTLADSYTGQGRFCRDTKSLLKH